MKIEDLKKQSGAIPSPFDERDFAFSVLPVVKREEIPEQFSLRSEQTFVKHQGEVGACTAFAACAINEILQKVKDLNERHLYSM
jgi:C1A family cysteine protease